MVAKGTIVYFGNFELPDKNAAALRVTNNGKIFTALGYRVVFLGIVRGELFGGIRQSSYDKNTYEEAYPQGTKQWLKHIFSTDNIDKVVKKYRDTCLIITYNMPYNTYKSIKKHFSDRNIKVAYDCTEWNNYSVGSLPKRLFKKFDEKRIRTRLDSVCDDIIVISSMMYRQYQDKNVLLLPPLVDISDSIWHQKAENDPNYFEFCFTGSNLNGTINAKERLDKVVQAFCELDDSSAKLRIIGLTEDEFINAYPEYSKIANAQKKIMFMGYVSHEESVKYILSCDCYIFIREKNIRNDAGFPTKFTESYTCGSTLVLNDISDVKKYSGDGRIVVINTTSAQEIKEAMESVIKQKTAHQNYGLNNTFDYHNFIKETDRWLNEALR